MATCSVNWTAWGTDFHHHWNFPRVTVTGFLRVLPGWAKRPRSDLASVIRRYFVDPSFPIFRLESAKAWLAAACPSVDPNSVAAALALGPAFVGSVADYFSLAAADPAFAAGC